ncbi:hypothetical protein Phi47:1_gp36 [Cellulophaga phage phi47:1]|uniref:hypothetical protein n=1 Tax=Cellulophaga phage phiSM TaxID=756280 RepID=UPI0002B78FAD|nr:hypothetical protein CEPG_00036 [Cellulophaga phage phiSM]AGF91634.1 hypothetical protein CDPG_00030 [Cellulophaga phage phi47:1]AGO47767.1 hypothetical protein Phi3ST:2_gp36 [Cellulophaga phage phi3ST:2]AGO49275.1 hypothetical protein Phi38:2_gp36 [Cellulophaga phage phi38:2]AGO49355.1 hypothetical protein Phi3:1_gp36 [Cellulophaga phage phi3:1]AGH07784.1 hypothetical protein CEPG_00036 [Cellulophaga phage phiSM]
MARKFLNIDECILIHDLKQVKKEPPMAKIKTKNKLAIKLIKNGVELSKTALYSRLSRYEKDGYDEASDYIANEVLKILEVTNEELIKEK